MARWQGKRLPPGCPSRGAPIGCRRKACAIGPGARSTWPAAITALFLLWPSMVVIALLIKFTSRGPVLFQQRRGGYWGRLFNVLKFRMYYDRRRVAAGRAGARRPADHTAGGVAPAAPAWTSCPSWGMATIRDKMGRRRFEARTPTALGCPRPIDGQRSRTCLAGVDPPETSLARMGDRPGPRLRLGAGTAYRAWMTRDDHPAVCLGSRPDTSTHGHFPPNPGSPALSMISGRQPAQGAAFSAGITVVRERGPAGLIESAGEPVSGTVPSELSSTCRSFSIRHSIHLVRVRRRRRSGEGPSVGRAGTSLLGRSGSLLHLLQDRELNPESRGRAWPSCDLDSGYTGPPSMFRLRSPRCGPHRRRGVDRDGGGWRRRRVAYRRPRKPMRLQSVEL